MESLKDEIIAQFRIRVFEESYPRIIRCLEALSEEETWYRPNPSSNSVGNLVLHLCGNMRQWIGTGMGDLPDIRERDEEFKHDQHLPQSELMRMMEKTKSVIEPVLDVISVEDLLQTRNVQIFQESGLSVMVHVIEHFSYHTGQIAYITKMLLNEQLNFYNEEEL